MHVLSYATLEQIVYASVHGILLVEANGHRARVRYANPAYERLSGYTQRELCGNAWSTHFAGECAFSDPEELNRAIMRGLPAVHEIVCLAKDGTAWKSRVHLSRVGGAAGDATLILAQHVVPDAPALDETEPSAGVTGQHAVLKAVPSGPAPAIPGMLSADQFHALLGRDLAIARRHERSLTLILFEIVEFDVYRQTFGSLAAEACARMIGTQILGTFGRSIDLRARLDSTTFAVAVHELAEGQPERLAAVVAEKTARLCLHNPRGRTGRHIEVSGACVQADGECNDVTAFVDKARRALAGDDVSAGAALHAAG